MHLLNQLTTANFSRVAQVHEVMRLGFLFLLEKAQDSNLENFSECMESEPIEMWSSIDQQLLPKPNHIFYNCF
jgi:hypothetical protein